MPLPKSALPKSKARDGPRDSPAKAIRTSRTRPLEPKESSTEFSEVDWDTEDKISDLEARLAILKQIKEAEDRQAAKAKAAPPTPKQG